MPSFPSLPKRLSADEIISSNRAKTPLTRPDGAVESFRTEKSEQMQRPPRSDDAEIRALSKSTGGKAACD